MIATPFDEQGARISPDGRWVFYVSDESGSSQGYVQSFPVPGNRQHLSKTGAFFGLWTRDGRELLLVRPD